MSKTECCERELENLRNGKWKIICLNCRAYANHSTSGCPNKKCDSCGDFGHISEDCEKINQRKMDYLSHLITYNFYLDSNNTSTTTSKEILKQDCNNNNTVEVKESIKCQDNILSLAFPEWPIR